RLRPGPRGRVCEDPLVAVLGRGPVDAVVEVHLGAGRGRGLGDEAGKLAAELLEVATRELVDRDRLAREPGADRRVGGLLRPSGRRRGERGGERPGRGQQERGNETWELT